MNHPSEWTKFFDENAGRYRYKHKGSGVICDTLMAIGKAFKGTAKNVVKTAVEKLQKQSLKKRGRQLAKLLSKKGQNKFNKYCENVSQNHNRCRRDAKKKLENILQNQVLKKPSLSSAALKLKLNLPP